MIVKRNSNPYESHDRVDTFALCTMSYGARQAREKEKTIASGRSSLSSTSFGFQTERFPREDHIISSDLTGRPSGFPRTLRGSVRNGLIYTSSPCAGQMVYLRGVLSVWHVCETPWKGEERSVCIAKSIKLHGAYIHIFFKHVRTVDNNIYIYTYVNARRPWTAIVLARSETACADG